MRKASMQTMNCIACNKPLTTNQIYEVLRGKAKGYCSKTCGATTHSNQVTKDCVVCGKSFTNAANRIKFQNSCSQKCAGRLASKRMELSNPMNDINVRDKMSQTLKAMKHCPPIRGGNGTGFTIPQAKLINELPIKCIGEYVVTVDIPKPNDYPNHYKIDIAIPESMIAIEVDGQSHNSIERRKQDTKKTNFLCSRNWKVLRFTNQEVMNNLPEVVSKIMSMI